MPVYSFICTACGHKFDALLPLSEREGARCPACDGSVERVYEGAYAFVKKPEGGACPRCPNYSDCHQ